jgi:DNA-binding CsgD family transcriptional regulator
MWRFRCRRRIITAMNGTRGEPTIVLCDERATFEAALAVSPPPHGFEIRGREDAAAAVLAAVRGRSLVLLAADGGFDPALLDDLGRVGRVEWRVPVARPALPPQEQRVLELLAEGRSLKEAAGLLFVSRRTADRRLRSARARLGVATTAEALVRFRALL